MFRSMNVRFLILSFGILFAFALAACGSNTSNSPTNVAPTNAPAQQATSAPLQSATSAPAQQATNAPAAIPTFEVPPPIGNDDSAQPSQKFDLNTASANDFLTIPNVGSRMVREFQEYRPYVSILQFRKEIGKYVDQNQVAEYEKYVYVPIDVNQADAATLQQIPGLDANAAAQLIAARPFDSNGTFIAKLATYVSADQLATAKTYLQP